MCTLAAVLEQIRHSMYSPVDVTFTVGFLLLL